MIGAASAGEIRDVDTCFGFGDGAVVDLDLSGATLDDDAAGGFAARGDENALSDRRVATPDGDRDFSGSIAGVGKIDGDEPRASIGT